MFAHQIRPAVSLVLGLALAASASAWARQDAKTKDDAVDSLLEKLNSPADDAPAKPASKTAKAAKTEEKATPRAGRSADMPDDGSRSKTTAGQNRKTATGAARKAAAPKSPGAGSVAPKDQAIDNLLEKLGATNEEPAPEDRPRRPGGSEEPGDRSNKPKATPAKLGGKDKDIDERLEEYTGRRKKRTAADDERSGPVGEIIKEMRDVEQRLGKPDPGKDTQNKQRQIVKRIETLIEQARQSGASGTRFVLRSVRQSGRERGQQPGGEQGALARGAPPMKPAKPTSQHSTAGGKEIWGHLPPELQQAMEASFKESELSSKAEMISRYFTSISKGKLVREE
jgi:hypothetical protein